MKATRELRISRTKLDARGWMSENYLFLQRRENCFLLTSPFIEPGSNHSATISSAKKNNLLIQFVCSEDFFKIRSRFLEKIVER